MKKLVIVIVTLLTFLSAKSQQVPLNTVINFRLPKNTEKTDKQNQRLIKSSSVGKLLPIRNEAVGEFYISGNTIIHLNGAIGVTTTDHLEKLKKGWDEIFKHDGSATNYTSTIKSINNYKILILNYDDKSNSHYNFYCVNNLHNKALSGSIEYNNSDKEQAAKLFKELSDSIEFK